MTLTEQIINEFREKFPNPDHERMSKCLCATENEHQTILDYSDKLGGFEVFLLSALTRVREATLEEAVKRMDMSLLKK